MSEPFAGTSVDPRRVLFVGRGTTAVFYYRCLLPAHSLGCDYVGVYGDPDRLIYATGLVKGQSKLPDFNDYDVVIIQQPSGKKWWELIDRLKARGITVLYEVDDYLEGIAEHEDHDFRDYFNEDRISMHHECMDLCDGMICSTQYIADKYAKYNPHRWVARNGIDPGRYNYSKTQRETVNVGWAGATGHRDAAVPWMQQVAAAMKGHGNVNFISIGEPFARGFHHFFPQKRALPLPWLPIEAYPGAMAMFDIALAPGGDSSFQRGKSDLRFLESALAGAAFIGNPHIYNDVQDGITGYHAESPTAAGMLMNRLIVDPEERKRTAAAAKAYVLQYRTIEQARKGWERAIVEAKNNKTPPSKQDSTGVQT